MDIEKTVYGHVDRLQALNAVNCLSKIEMQRNKHNLPANGLSVADYLDPLISQPFSLGL